MNLIKTDIVSVKYDALWYDAAADTASATPRPIAVIVNTYEAGSVEQTQLQKMLEACKLAPEQYNIVQVSKDGQAAWHQVRERLNPKIIFLIGVMPAQLGISALFRLNEPNRFNDRIWLPTIGIAEQEQHPDMKKQLWANGMKPLFVDKSFGTF